MANHAVLSEIFSPYNESELIDSEYYLQRFVACSRQDLSAASRKMLYNTLLVQTTEYEPIVCLDYSPFSIDDIYNISTFDEFCTEKRLNRLSGEETMLSNISPIEGFPILSLVEIKKSGKFLWENPSVSSLSALLGVIISYLVGGTDELIWIMFCSGVIYAGLDNIPVGIAQSPNLSQRLLKRLEMFICPFILLTVVILLLHTLQFTNVLPDKLFVFFRGAIIFVLVLRDVIGIFERLEEKGFKIPRTILAFIKATEATAKTSIDTFLDNFQAFRQ